MVAQNVITGFLFLIRQRNTDLTRSRKSCPLMFGCERESTSEYPLLMTPAARASDSSRASTTLNSAIDGEAKAGTEEEGDGGCQTGPTVFHTPSELLLL